MRKLLAALAVFAVVACTSTGPRSIEVPEARLQALIGQRFPIERRLFNAFPIRVGVPRLTLVAESNRIAVELDVDSPDRVGGGTRLGTVAASAGLRYDAGAAALRLAEVRIERFELDGVPAPWQRQLDRVGRPFIAGLLDGQAVYTLQEKDLARLRLGGLQPGDIRVTPTGLVVTLLPAPR